MGETSWTLTIDTERLILRPLQPSDYESWYAGFSGRLPKQHQYDDGQVSLEECDRQWFADLCQRHQQLALNDQVYIFGIFSRQNNQHLGHIDISTIRREENQWANLGYGIHNQHWQQGFGKEAVRAALICGFHSFVGLKSWSIIALKLSLIWIIKPRLRLLKVWVCKKNVFVAAFSTRTSSG